MAVADLGFRGVVTRLAAAAATLLAVGSGALVVTGTPAAAHGGFTGRLTADCVVRGPHDTYRAVFGYDNRTTTTVSIPVGAANAMTPSRLNGIQTTRFVPGAHRGAFATGAVPNGQQVTWKVGSLTATATASSPTCGPSVSLPAEGNGTGPLIALAGSVLVAFGVVAFRRRRPRTGGA